jgi:hypothetical protein
MCLKKKARFITLFILVFSITLSVFPKKQINQSNWADKPVVVDGKGSEWEGISLLENKKLKIDYAFKNDMDYLYIFFVFNDGKYMSTLSSSGLTIWLNSTFKKKKNFGIKFKRRTITPEAFISIVESKQGPLSEEQKAKIKQKKFYTIFQNGVIKKGSDEAIPITIASKIAPAFSVKTVNRTFVFEFKIPLKKVEGQVVGIGSEPGKDIMLGFEWGGMTKEMKAAMSQGGRGYRSSSSKGGVSDNQPGSREASGLSSAGGTGGDTRTRFARSSVPKKYSFWVPLHLSQK